jgi:hypothetical protein
MSYGRSDNNNTPAWRNIQRSGDPELDRQMAQIGYRTSTFTFSIRPVNLLPCWP